MDEAERCHELAYISYGKLLAHGSAAELIAGAGLVTCEITVPGLADELVNELATLSRALRDDPRIRTVAPFGAALHVSASSQADLDAALAPYRDSGIRIRAVKASLEDVFNALMQDAKDNVA